MLGCPLIRLFAWEVSKDIQKAENVTGNRSEPRPAISQSFRSNNRDACAMVLRKNVRFKISETQLNIFAVNLVLWTLTDDTGAATCRNSSTCDVYIVLKNLKSGQTSYTTDIPIRLPEYQAIAFHKICRTQRTTAG